MATVTELHVNGARCRVQADAARSLLQVLRHLEIEGDRAVPVDPDGHDGTIHGQLAGVDSVTIPLCPKVTQLLADQDVNMLRHTLDLTETQA